MSSMFIDPTGQPTYGLGICARCSRKMVLSLLMPDPNSPGLMVCEADRDDYDPYRLAPRKEDQMSLPFVRPDTHINAQPSGIIREDGSSFFITEDGDKYLEI